MFRDLIEQIRSSDEEERKLTIAMIPSLVLQYYEQESDIVKQILLLIYNLSTDSDIYENLTLSNRSKIIRHLLRLYNDKIGDQYKQVDALAKLVDHVSSSEVLIELTNVLYQCKQVVNNAVLEDALDNIKGKAAANLYLDAILFYSTKLSFPAQQHTR